MSDKEVLILIILEVLYEFRFPEHSDCRRVLILIILEVLYECIILPNQ